MSRNGTSDLASALRVPAGDPGTSDVAATLGRLADALRLLMDGKNPASVDAEGPGVPPPELAELVHEVNRLIEVIGEIWTFVMPLASGAISVSPPKTRNPMLSPFKTLHAHLRHMTWQARQVTAGDYGQRMDFLGEFSESFNTMVEMIASREKALQAANGELSRTLEQLRAAQAKLVEAEKLSAMGRLLAQFSHEMNNPLNAVQNNLGPTREYFDELRHLLSEVREKASASPELSRFLDARTKALDLPFVEEDGARAFQVMSESCRRMTDIHRNLAMFLRGGAGTELVEADLNEGIRSTALMLERKDAARVRIELDLAPLPRIRLPAGALNQVFFNLVKNALDAIGDAGSVSIRSGVKDGRIVVSVEDTGPGIPEDVRGKIFEPFFTTKPVGKGTGLGLPTSREIVTRLGGNMYLDPDHAPGARFVIELPFFNAVEGGSAHG